jgi:hypothetical protein
MDIKTNTKITITRKDIDKLLEGEKLYGEIHLNNELHSIEIHYDSEKENKHNIRCW